MGSTLGALLGPKNSRLAYGILGGMAGALVGGIVDAATPAAQRWICGDCGCSHVEDLAIASA